MNAYIYIIKLSITSFLHLFEYFLVYIFCYKFFVHWLKKLRTLFLFVGSKSTYFNCDGFSIAFYYNSQHCYSK